MTKKSISAVLIIFLALGSSVIFAEKYKYPKLKPADPPCLYLLDDEGNETGVAGNPPCDSRAAANPGGGATTDAGTATDLSPAQGEMNTQPVSSDGMSSEMSR
ncbi:MAG: hypothetical protein V7711_14810 [Pseudomonadales bacterium]